jgi:hypothetical protein
MSVAPPRAMRKRQDIGDMAFHWLFHLFNRFTLRSLPSIAGRRRGKRAFWQASKLCIGVRHALPGNMDILSGKGHLANHFGCLVGAGRKCFGWRTCHGPAGRRRIGHPVCISCRLNMHGLCGDRAGQPDFADDLRRACSIPRSDARSSFWLHIPGKNLSLARHMPCLADRTTAM